MPQVTLIECINRWNAQADEYNQWHELDANERCEWCLKLANEENAQLRYVLGRILHDLPTYRDWLNPDLEKAAKALMKEENP